jgi:hypothetical protein
MHDILNIIANLLMSCSFVVALSSSRCSQFEKKAWSLFIAYKAMNCDMTCTDGVAPVNVPREYGKANAKSGRIPFLYGLIPMQMNLNGDTFDMAGYDQQILSKDVASATYRRFLSIIMVASTV